MIECAKVLFNDKIWKTFSKTPLPNNKIKRRIDDMSSDILKQVIHQMDESKFPMSICIDESNDEKSKQIF